MYIVIPPATSQFLRENEMIIWDEGKYWKPGNFGAMCHVAMCS